MERGEGLIDRDVERVPRSMAKPWLRVVGTTPCRKGNNMECAGPKDGEAARLRF